MKILIILFSLILTGCAATNAGNDIAANVAQWHQEGLPGNTQKFSKKGFPVGTWEGIERTTAELKVLNLTNNRSHTLSTYKIAFGFELISQIRFDDDDITCGKFDCHILTTTKGGAPHQLTLTPHIGLGFKVVDAIKLRTNEIYSSSYLLKKNAKLTMPEQFHQHASAEPRLNNVEYNRPWYGFWMGVLDTSGEQNLKIASLKFLPDEQAVFTVYTPGLEGKAEMTFDPLDITQSKGELSTKLQGSPFANELTMRPTLLGISGSYTLRTTRAPERLLTHGDFTLIKVKKR